MGSEVSYRKDSTEATRDATPQTITVAMVRFEPVPPPDAPPGMSRSQRSKFGGLELARGLKGSGGAKIKYFSVTISATISHVALVGIPRQ